MLVLGRGAEDLSVGQFLASKEPQTLTGLEGMDHFWKHFEPGCQDDVGHFMGRLWAFSGSSFFGGRFFHVHETGRARRKGAGFTQPVVPTGADTPHLGGFGHLLVQ